MAIERYVKMEEVEELVAAMMKIMIKPALRRLVEDSSNPYDDAALAIAMPMIDTLIDKISEK